MHDRLKRVTETVKHRFSNRGILKLIRLFEKGVAKILSAALLMVIFVALVDLILILLGDLFREPFGFFNRTVIDVFGLFLNILIALELLENITAYLQENRVRLELVISTSLIAIARKIIIFDFSKFDSSDLIALSVAIFALSISYWTIKHLNAKAQ